MSNAFDQFDSATAVAEAPKVNAFDQFDAPKANPFDHFDAPKQNPFDQFDTAPVATAEDHLAEAKSILDKVQAPRKAREAMLQTARDTGQPILMVNGEPTLGAKPVEAPLSAGDQIVQGLERGLGGAGLRVAEGAARLTGASETADSLGETVAGMDSVLPEQTKAGRVGTGIGGAAALLSGGGMYGALGIAGTQAVAGGYDAAYQNAIGAGYDEDTARKAAQYGGFKSAIKSVPELAAYWLLGAGAAKAVAPLVKQAGPVATGLVSGTAATAANVATSTALHGIHGEPLFTPEGLATDATFGFLAHGLEVGRAAAKSDASVREFLKSAPQDALEAAAGDPNFRKSAPYSPKLIDEELASRKTAAPAPEPAAASAEGSGAAEKTNDWTEATAATETRGMKRATAGSEAGAITLPKIDIPERKMSELDQATTDRSAKLQRSTDDATRVQKEIQKAIPKEDRQGAVSVWIEADGDLAKLQAWEAGAKGEAFKKAAEAAQSLTPEELAIADKVRQTFKILEARGNKYDVLGSHRENYVPHVWDVDKNKPAMTGSAKLQNNFKFAKARTFEDFAAGDAAGFKPKTLAIGKLLPAYLHEMNKVIADRQFVEDLSQRTAKDGRPLVVPRGRVSEIAPNAGGKAYLANPRAMKTTKDSAGNAIDTGDYKTMESQPALHDWRWEGKDADGNPIFMKDDLAVHPEAAKRINSMLGKSAIREWYNDPTHTGSAKVLPAIVKGLDTAQSVMKREMFSLVSPFHQVQEGWHAISHLVNPFFGLEKIDLRKPEQADAARHGLMILPDKTSAQQYIEGVGGKGGFVSQAARKFGGEAGKAVADVIDGYQDYLFKSYIPKLKYGTYEAIRGRNMARYADELASGKMTEADVKLLSAEQTNAAYGHLNYALLDRNPTMQHLVQLGLLAPDFLEARARFVGQAAKGLIGAKQGREQLKAIATIAAVQAGIAYTLTQLGGDQWDPKHPFEVVHKGRRYTLRSVPEDIASLISDPRQFTYGRVNPLTVKGAVQLETGLNYRGEKTSALQTMEELLAQYIPITARAIPGVRALTETSQRSPISPLEQLAGSMGLRISRKSPITDTYKLAGDWMEKQGEPKEIGSYPVSKYQQLRYALEDGDSDRAGKELDALTKGTTAEKVAQGFKESVDHPFTKSRTMDDKFRQSLSQKDRAVFDLAARKRESILQAFSNLRSHR